eukprot:1157746-Pelagomonas_calceolata.AAC.10
MASAKGPPIMGRASPALRNCAKLELFKQTSGCELEQTTAAVPAGAPPLIHLCRCGAAQLRMDCGLGIACPHLPGRTRGYF